jgi:FAD/FMN-containing dehydrogenase
LALALKIFTVTQSKFAIRSGGHMANPGFSSVGDSGLLLDLGALNDITLSSKGDVVSVGPGATWDKLYEKLKEHELTVVGGRVSGVGVGGLVTGGSPFHFLPRSLLSALCE